MTRCFRVVDLRVSIFILFSISIQSSCKSVSPLILTSDNCHIVFSGICHPGRLVWANAYLRYLRGKGMGFFQGFFSFWATVSVLGILWCLRSPYRNTRIIRRRMLSTTAWYLAYLRAHISYSIPYNSGLLAV
ncbi:hypothetical protein BJY52DRAFT_450277 [Lactarius psammicola]|nr:hypothetical protein BJY52DRAFT_450277 [Lactarius psammicola]